MTATPTPTATSTLTTTPTLATLVLHITAINPGVIIEQPPTATVHVSPTPLPTVAVPLPQLQIPLPAADAPLPGWVRYETADSAFHYVAGRWLPFQTIWASQGGYSYSADPEARVTLTFTGAGVRVRYVAYTLYGIFQIRIDGQVVAEIDSYSPRAAFLVTDIFGLAQGQHTVEIANTGRKNPASASYMLALDNIEVYRGLPSTITPTNTPSQTIRPTLTPARAQVQLVAVPPSIQPTPTDVPPGLVAASLVIAYDENGNSSIDPAEGVQGISARLVTIGTNEVIASGYTNGEGFVHLEALTDAQVRLVVPYFGKFWNLSGGHATEQRFSLLIPPANQPGLIP
jgi:hypothetical protein